MGFSGAFIRRPVATILLSIGLLIAGCVAYVFLPVASLPSIDTPFIVVFAGRPGADPETMANSIAAPLERHLGIIPGVTEMTSTSSIGNTSIVMQFDISRSVEGAAHDVQAAINAATPDLPSDLPTRPYFRKFNPAETPVLWIALTSDTLSMGQVYDAADSILAQRLSQVEGVAQVTVNGAEKPAVRVQLDPAALQAAGLAAQDIVTVIRGANVDGATGGFQGKDRAETIGLNGQISTAREYAPLVLKNANGAILRLSDVARVIDDVANVRLAASFNHSPAILVSITKAAGANVIDVVDRVRAALPLLQSWMPPDIKLDVYFDRTTTIRASVDDVQYSMLVSIALVLIVVALFMRRRIPTIAAGVTVPLSIAGTLAAMWFYSYSLDNFSIMALTISVGFVVDDAIVMIENIVRHMEQGKTPMQAALDGSRQIGFTVLSISVSLVAVFIPIIFMGGLLGRFLHEFAMTLTLAIVVSAVVSLTLTPMLCGRFMRADEPPLKQTWWSRIDATVDNAFKSSLRVYARTLGWSLRHRWLMGLTTIGTMVLTVWLYGHLPKSSFPTQDTGLMGGNTVADPSISFAAMGERQHQAIEAILADPAVEGVSSIVGVTSGWASPNRGQLAVMLKPLRERDATSEQVIARLRPKLAAVGGLQTFLYSVQDFRTGGRAGNATQYALIDPDLAELRDWTNRLEERLRDVPEITDVYSDQDRTAPQANVVIDREAAARLGVSVTAIDNALNNAFAQRQISIIYTPRNQYRVVLETDPKLQTDPAMLDRIYVGASNGTQVPLGSVARIEIATAPLAVRHQGQYPASTITFNTKPGVVLGAALDAVRAATDDLRMPETVHAEFAGNALFLSQSLGTMPILIGAALLAMYIVLGVLYESLTQPITILSTLPPAGLGALLTLWLTGVELSMMAFVGIMLLIGIVKKNAIMVVDFALEQERVHGRTPMEAVHAACIERFRPIIMTTMSALLGAVPLAAAFGTGAELRRPLGVAIIGGLIVSQALTLYTTPIVYLALQPRRRAAPVPA
jgi:multidrug efflux pump